MEAPKDGKKLEKVDTIEAKKLFDFEEWGLKGEWLHLSSSDGNFVEGAYYQADNNNGEVVIFHPGLPGDTVARFEENFVGPLLQEGYNVFVARHNGLKKQENNEELFHNKKKSEGEDGIPGQPLDWFTEPEVSIKYFSQQNKKITLLTHSFSGITAANSFIKMTEENPAMDWAQKVNKWILASASIWDLGKDNFLDPERNLTKEDMLEYCKHFASRYSMDTISGPEILLQKILETLESIGLKIRDSLPEDTEVIGIYPQNDKLVSPQIGINFLNKLKRGIILRDNHAPPDEDIDLHDFNHAEADNLLRILKMKTSKFKHIFDINK